MAAFKKVSPFSQPLPDDRISLCVYADNTGLRMWNKNSDPMPIKTINMAGLQKWEETDDYIIYLDKDAVMTTVEQYVTGTYDLFKEHKADIDGAMDLLKINNIEWTSEDDSKLILDINKAQLERIANTPTTMEEEDFMPQTFTARAVPTTYECCFRVDKSSSEIYIGEGYENIWSNSNFETSETVRVSVDIENNRVKLTQITQPTTVFNFYRSVFPTFDGKSTYSSSCFIEKMTTSSYVMYSGARYKDYMINTTYLKSEIPRSGATYFGIGLDNLAVVGEEIEAKNFQITKTSTLKPFVKSIMPSGKLAFVTNATSDTHSFVIKNLNATKRKPDNDHTYIFQTIKNGYILTNKDANTNDSVIVSNFLSKYGHEDLYIEGQSVGLILGKLSQTTNYSFKQLLIYNGNLTEAELKTENEKNIRLK